jgi:hypothetical protein
MKTHIHERLDEFFDETIINIAKRLGYNIENILVLEDKELLLKTEYPRIYGNLESCKHQRDKRSLMEYAQDLVCSWVFEDYLIVNLKNLGLNIEHAGEDRNREILSSSKVSANSDFLINNNNKKLYVELANDYTGYWLRRLQIDLRDDKYLRIKNKLNNGDVSVLLGIDLINKKYFIHDFSDEENVKYIEYHPPFSKPAYSIKLEKNKINDFSFEKVCYELMIKLNKYN